MFTDNQNLISQIEKQIQDKRDRIYKLLDEGRSLDFLKIEYKDLAVLIAQKFQLLKKALRERSQPMSDEELKSIETRLDAEMKEDLIAVAVAIDNAFEQKQNTQNE